MRSSGKWMWSSVALAALLTAVACGGAGHEGEDREDDDIAGPSAPTSSNPPSTPPGPGPAPTPTPSVTPPASVAYVQDIKPILDADCVRCHGEFSSYVGVLGAVQPGSASSRLVRATQLGGSMYGYLSGNAPAKAELIRRWVVENGAAESR